MATYGVKILVHGMKVATPVTGKTKAEAEKLANESNKIAIEGGLEGYKAVVCIEMDARERAINRLIQNAVSEWIGGYENVLLDYPEDSDEYKEAKAVLNHDTLFSAIYSDVMSGSQTNYQSHIRFVGKAFIEGRIEAALKKNGYGK